MFPPYAINAKQIYACFPSAIRRSTDGLTTSGDLTNDTWILISQLRLGRNLFKGFYDITPFVPAGLNASKNYGYYEQANARLGPPYYFGHDSIPPPLRL